MLCLEMKDIFISRINAISTRGRGSHTRAHAQNASSLTSDIIEKVLRTLNWSDESAPSSECWLEDARFFKWYNLKFVEETTPGGFINEGNSTLKPSWKPQVLVVLIK